jgi:hypothetical protein
MANLWDLSSIPVCDDDDEFESWQDFIKTKPWTHGVYSKSKPVHWSWIKLDPEEIKEIKEIEAEIEAEIEENFNDQKEIDDGEDSGVEPTLAYSIDTLALIYLQISELYVKCIKVSVKEEEQDEIRKWLFENKFLTI